MNPEPPTMIKNQGIYPFDLFFQPVKSENRRIRGISAEKTHFLVKWETLPARGPLSEECVPQIIVRFAHHAAESKYRGEFVQVHFTARSAAGHYQPWGAWDGCTLQGDAVDHGRKIWHMIRKSGGNYSPVKGTDPALREWGLTTRYKDQVWTPNADMFPGVDEYISKIHSDYALDA